MIVPSVLFCVLALPPPPSVKATVHQASLFAPGPPRTIGSVTNLEMRLVSWVSPTRVKVEHKGPVIDLFVELDLTDDQTYVEIAVPNERVLAGTDPWTVVMRPSARVPLVGGTEGGLELGFLAADQGPVTHATLPRSSSQSAPATSAPVEKCPVKAMHAAASKGSATWVPAPPWKVHRAAKSTRGFRAAFAEAAGVVVHGFIADADVKCPPPPPQKGAPSPAADPPEPVNNESSVQVREAKLPAGSALYATTESTSALAILHKPARAFRREDGSWMVPSMTEGKASVELHGLHHPANPNLVFGPQQITSAGASYVPREDWPRRRAPE